VKARLPSSAKATIGKSVGLVFRADRLSVFDAASGRAVRTALHDEARMEEAVHG
jgi:multiple sugar transport system ATP-binding protein